MPASVCKLVVRSLRITELKCQSPKSITIMHNSNTHSIVLEITQKDTHVHDTK